MSILIRGMEMPKNCYACIFFAQTDYWNKEDEADILSHCKRTGEKTWESVNGYLPNCPLVPVKAPHGRLIDADANLAVMMRVLDAPYTSHGTIDTAMLKACIKMFEEAPTIIPAEEGET